MGIDKSSRTDFVHLCLVSEFFDIYQVRHLFSEYFSRKFSLPHMLKQDLAGFIRGNQVIRLQSAEGSGCNDQFARSNKG